jgi:hypothetical protein
LCLYLNHHVRVEITQGLKRRGVDALTAFEDGRREADDAMLLDRAMELGRVFFSQDGDLLIHASHRQQTNHRFGGLIHAHQLALTIGQCIDELELVAKACEPRELQDRVIFLPL